MYLIHSRDLHPAVRCPDDTGYERQRVNHCARPKWRRFGTPGGQSRFTAGSLSKRVLAVATMDRYALLLSRSGDQGDFDGRPLTDGNILDGNKKTLQTRGYA